MKRRISKIAAAVLTFSLMLTGCGTGGKSGGEIATEKPAEISETVTEAPTEAVTEAASAEEGEPPLQQFSFSGKSFTITLYADKAPITCENFEKLVGQGFYDGLTFHRVIDEFMAQGGDPTGTGAGGSDTTIKGEFKSNGVENDLSHTRGVISMARSQDPNSASSQFFICFTDNPNVAAALDGEYAAFGKVTEGMDVVDAFLEVPRTTSLSGEPESAPTVPITIDKAVMGEKDANGNSTVIITMK